MDRGAFYEHRDIVLPSAGTRSLAALHPRYKPCPSPEVEFCLREHYRSRAGLGIESCFTYNSGKILASCSPNLYFRSWDVFILGMEMSCFAEFILKVPEAFKIFAIRTGNFSHQCFEIGIDQRLTALLKGPRTPLEYSIKMTYPFAVTLRPHPCPSP